MHFEVQLHVLVKSWLLCGLMADVVLHAANLSVFHLQIVLTNVIDKTLSMCFLQVERGLVLVCELHVKATDHHNLQSESKRESKGNTIHFRSSNFSVCVTFKLTSYMYVTLQRFFSRRNMHFVCNRLLVQWVKVE